MVRPAHHNQIEIAMPEVELCAWLGSALPGDRLAYHRGVLCRDCSPTNSRLDEKNRAELQRVARRARLASDMGLAYLVQRRNGPDDYTYLVIARKKPRNGQGALKTVVGIQEAGQWV